MAPSPAGARRARRARAWSCRALPRHAALALLASALLAVASAAAVPARRASLPWYKMKHMPGNVSAYALHLIGSRFSLNQGEQTHLNEGRLQLFRTICLPTVAAQLPRRFVWLIYTDTTLPQSMYARLQALVRPWPSFHVLRHPASDAKLYARSVQEQLHDAGLWAAPRGSGPSTRLAFLHTRLDADDGLANGTVGRLQAAAGAQLRRPEMLQSGRCAGACWPRAVEWLPAATDSRHGALVSSHPIKSADGVEVCLSAGLTSFGWENASECHAHKGGHLDFGKRLLHLDKLERALPIRARSATSNSMSGVLPEENSGARLHPAETLGRYNISARALARCAEYLRRATKQIARDQLAKRCVFGFGCRTYAAAALAQLAHKSEAAALKRNVPAKRLRPRPPDTAPASGAPPAGAAPAPDAASRRRAGGVRTAAGSPAAR